MRDLYDLLRNTIAAELQAKSDEARDQLEYARGAIVEAIVQETRHTDIGGGSDIRTDGEDEWVTAGLTDGHALRIDHRGTARVARVDPIMLPLKSGRIKPGCPPTVQVRTEADPRYRTVVLELLARRLA